MSLTNPNTPVSQKDLQDFYHKLLPYIGSSDGHTIEDNNGTDYEQRDTLQFSDGLLVEDDNINKKTIISSNVMQNGDINDIITPLPSVQQKYHKYSTEEQIVGEWIDGKPIYQKIVYNTTLATIPNNSWVQYCSITNLKAVISFSLIRASSDGTPSNGVFNDISGSTDGNSVKCIARASTLTLDNSKSYAIIQYTKTTD